MTAQQYSEALHRLAQAETVTDLEPLYELVDAGGAYVEELAEQLDQRKFELEEHAPENDGDLGEPPSLSEAARQELREIVEEQGLTLPDYY